MHKGEYVFDVTECKTPERLDIYLSENEMFPSRAKVVNLIKNKSVFVNGKNEKASYKVRFGDKITVVTGEDYSPVIVPENIHVETVYENDDIIVVNKPKNMLTHPTIKETTGTLVNALLYKYGYDGLSDINGILRPGIVHRLDRNTSGLLLIAKNNAAHEYLSEKIRTKEIKRNYLAVVCGNFNEETGTVNAPVGRHPTKPEKMSVVDDGKPSVTHFRVIEQFKGYSFIELMLETGRTHQIRVHMQYISHPVVNDSLYNKIPFKVKTTEQVLQSYKLKFAPPNYNDIIELELKPDEDIEKVLRYLRSLK